MTSYLERLGIHPKVQSFFKPYLTITGETLIFNHGNAYEHVSADFHKIPITEEFWTAGELTLATDIFICGSAMDAIAWLNLNGHRYRQFQTLCFISTGNVPHSYHAETIQKYMPKKKLHFLFSKDSLGAICDLKFSSFIRNKPLKISYEEQRYEVNFENKNYEFEHLSLSALEKATGYNFRIRTHKPKNASTYYELLRNRHPP
ncbi:MAG TPA: hypothetical protein VK668_04480 [Mucilaginibacter sp.]|nr:hypothetical protein [Mucilaginibacter sp.]